MIKTVIKLIIIFVLCLLFSTGNKEAYTFIESATPGILGSLLGGLTAGISVIFTVLITIGANKGTACKFKKFESFLNSLKNDMFVLVLCLIVSIVVPYLRLVGIPFLTYPSFTSWIPERNITYTAIELTSIVVSFLLIFEVIKVMFVLIQCMPALINDNQEKEQSPTKSDSNE